MSGISEVLSFYYGNKVFIVYLRSVQAYSIVAEVAKLRKDCLVLAMVAAILGTED